MIEDRFIIEYAANRGAADHTLFAGCTHYPFLEAAGNPQVFVLFAEADDSFKIFQIKLSSIKLQLKCITDL